ncbi:MAG TPA: hypothetical protein VNV82_17825 [Bryobacteraceae bacterium]|jgi:hypothetical protein|nr:hypothetical protein [Bryobacteraceae bacterium]
MSYGPTRDISFEVLVEIRNLLTGIRLHQERRFFFPIGQKDGSTSWVNLFQAAEIHRISDVECQIKFPDGGVISIGTKEGVDAVIQAIQKEIVLIEELPKARQPQAQNK